MFIKRGYMKPNNQTEALLEHLKKYGNITSIGAIQMYGITRLSAKIYTLRALGYQIYTEREKSKNRYGNIVSFARYYLVKEK